eukprot:12932441-Prorocentrum_lima.AAC.1
MLRQLVGARPAGFCPRRVQQTATPPPTPPRTIAKISLTTKSRIVDRVLADAGKEVASLYWRVREGGPRGRNFQH